MQITADFDELCKMICPHCREGRGMRFRADSGEWVHDVKTVHTFAHSICWANGLRKKYQDGK